MADTEHNHMSSLAGPSLLTDPAGQLAGDGMGSPARMPTVRVRASQRLDSAIVMRLPDSVRMRAWTFGFCCAFPRRR